MKLTMKVLRAGVICATAALGLGVGTASADIVLTPNPGSNTGTDNVVFNPCSGIVLGPANTVQGCLNSSPSTIVNFTSGELLEVNGGQARIEAADIETGGTFNDLQIALDSGDPYTALIFNINTAPFDTGTITIFVQTTGADPDFTFTNLAIAQGQNFFRVDAINGETIDFVSFQTSGAGVLAVEFQDVRQVRIGGIDGTLPEPGALALLGTVLGAVGITGRRRKPRLD